MPATSSTCFAVHITAPVRRRSRRRLPRSSAAPRPSRDKMATTAAPPPTRNIGKVVQVIGPVLDVEFEAEKLPEIYNALRITRSEERRVGKECKSRWSQYQ